MTHGICKERSALIPHVDGPFMPVIQLFKVKKNVPAHKILYSAQNGNSGKINWHKIFRMDNYSNSGYLHEYVCPESTYMYVCNM